ncbi:hypothetical protein BX600DRAFT_551393 [Xylariales sp. PMI_506]|nr:hypothetical protein BX600DRAFT_551393 [Xylariales sp. PMI_506]
MNQSYSTLEVHYSGNGPPDAQEYETYPEVVSEYHDYPEAAPAPYPEAVGAEYMKKEQPYNGVEGGVALPDGQHTTTADRICGVKRKTFYILLGLAVVVIIGAIAGGVGGGLASKHKSDDKNSTPSSTSLSGSSTNVNILDTSTLASSNWTDGNGYNHRIVVFQDPYSYIIARQWDSQNDTWATTNISLVMASSPTPLDPAVGTTLAVASLDWVNTYTIYVYFLDTTSTLKAVYCGNAYEAPDLWLNSSMASNDLQVYPGSRIAAAWDRCNFTDCVGDWVIAYQEPGDGAIRTTNWSDWSQTWEVASGNIAGNTSLAIIPQYSGSEKALGVVWQSYSSGTKGAMEVTTWNGSEWLSVDTEVISDVPLPAQDQGIVVGRWYDWATTLFYVLLDDGTLRGSWMNGSQVTAIPTITLEGGSATNFSTVAMTLDSMVYGIYNDTVLEYSVDTSDPSILHYVGQVYP